MYTMSCRKALLKGVFFFCFCMLFTSCMDTESEFSPSGRKGWKKNNSKNHVNPIAIVREAFLVGKNQKEWFIYKFVVAGQDLTSTVGNCNLDNVITIYKNGDYIETEGATKCFESAPDPHNTGTWRWNEDRTEISLVSPNLTTTFTVIDITPVHLVLEFYDENLKAPVQFWFKPTFLRI